MTDIADRYRRLAARFTTVVDAVPDDRWTSPSPCEGWSAAEVVAHVADTQAELVDRLGLGPPPAPLPPTPADRWSAVRDVVQRLLADPTTSAHRYEGYLGPPTFGETIDRFYAFDLVVHAWDLARATGLASLEQIDPAEVDRVRADAEGMGDALRMEGICGQEVEVATDATAQERLLAFLGRTP